MAVAESGASISSLEGMVGGCWRVETQSGSVYQVDLDGRTLRRVNDEYALRRDGEVLRLHRVLACEVGEDGHFAIQVVDDAVTFRLTTTILSITRIRGLSPET